MTEMLERMARAGLVEVESGCDMNEAEALRFVRAVLKAMRKPTEDVVSAGSNVSMELSAHQVYHAWQAMLDAIDGESR